MEKYFNFWFEKRFSICYCITHYGIYLEMDWSEAIDWGVLMLFIGVQSKDDLRVSLTSGHLYFNGISIIMIEACT